MSAGEPNMLVMENFSMALTMFSGFTLAGRLGSVRRYADDVIAGLR